jgi:hypothetical protein
MAGAGPAGSGGSPLPRGKRLASSDDGRTRREAYIRRPAWPRHTVLRHYGARRAVGAQEGVLAGTAGTGGTPQQLLFGLTATQWERKSLDTANVPHHGRTFDFPPADLLPVLVDKYFEETDVLFSLLYRPAVERAVRDGLHLRDEAFACVLLMICAVGAPFVDDARVRIDGAPRSVGWRYFRQVQLVRKSLLAPPNLYDLQLYCVRSLR